MSIGFVPKTNPVPRPVRQREEEIVHVSRITKINVTVTIGAC